MSYTVFTDGCSNLPGDLIERFQIEVLPCSYIMDGEPGLCWKMAEMLCT